MSYNDPYSNYPPGAGSRYQNQPQAPGDALDSAPEFNPYIHHPHQTYDQGDTGYDNYGPSRFTDEPVQPSAGHDKYEYEPDYIPGSSNSYPPPQRALSGATSKPRTPSLGVIPIRKEDSGFDKGEFTPIAPKARTPSALRAYRYDHQGNMWTKGSRAGCITRFFCCTVLTALLLFVCIVLSVGLWVRPPAVTIGGVDTISANGSTIQVQSNGIKINLGVNFTVENPNPFSVTFPEIKALITYPINNTNVGTGDLKNVVIRSNQETNFTFPFTIDYQTNLDPGSKILIDLAGKCGVGGTKSDISVNYKITVGVRIVFITIHPVFSNSFSFACPIDPADIESVAKNAGLSNLLPGITGA